METIHPENSCPFSILLARSRADRFMLPGLESQLAFIYVITLEYFPRIGRAFQKPETGLLMLLVYPIILPQAPVLTPKTRYPDS